jgi:hypothetical protein
LSANLFLPLNVCATTLKRQGDSVETSPLTTSLAIVSHAVVSGALNQRSRQGKTARSRTGLGTLRDYVVFQYDAIRFYMINFLVPSRPISVKSKVGTMSAVCRDDCRYAFCTVLETCNADLRPNRGSAQGVNIVHAGA